MNGFNGWVRFSSNVKFVVQPSGIQGKGFAFQSHSSWKEHLKLPNWTAVAKFAVLILCFSSNSQTTTNSKKDFFAAIYLFRNEFVFSKSNWKQRWNRSRLKKQTSFNLKVKNGVQNMCVSKFRSSVTSILLRFSASWTPGNKFRIWVSNSGACMLPFKKRRYMMILLSSFTCGWKVMEQIFAEFLK